MESVGGTTPGTNVKLTLSGNMEDLTAALGQFDPVVSNKKVFMDALINLYQLYNVSGGKAKHASMDFPQYAKKELNDLYLVLKENVGAEKRTPQKEMKRLTKTLVQLGVVPQMNQTSDQKMAQMMALTPGGIPGQNPMMGGMNPMMGGMNPMMGGMNPMMGGMNPMMGGMNPMQFQQQMMCNQTMSNPMMLFQQFPYLGKMLQEYCSITDKSEKDVAREKLELSTELDYKIQEYNKYCFAKDAFMKGKKDGILSLNDIEIKLLETKVAILKLSDQLKLQAM